MGKMRRKARRRITTDRGVTTAALFRAGPSANHAVVLCGMLNLKNRVAFCKNEQLFATVSLFGTEFLPHKLTGTSYCSPITEL